MVNNCTGKPVPVPAAYHLDFTLARRIQTGKAVAGIRDNRPDGSGIADALIGDDRIILTVRPGITGPATLKYRNEEELLARQSDPEKYNTEVIYPDKVRLNREYVEQYSFWRDLKYIVQTITGK